MSAVVASLGRPGVDARVPRFNQGVTGVLLLVAFLFDWRWAVPVLGAILGAGAFFGARGNLWGLLFVHAVRPGLRLGEPKKRKDPAPTRFAQLLGFLFLAAATVVLYVWTGGVAFWVGWGLALAVAGLALLAAITDICVGCEIYNLGLRLRARGDEAATGE